MLPTSANIYPYYRSNGVDDDNDDVGNDHHEDYAGFVDDGDGARVRSPTN